MKIKCFKEESLHKLKVNIEKNIENRNYFREDIWVQDFFDENEEYEFESTIDIELPELLLPDETKKVKIGYDLENAKKLYGALKMLTREQARDARLWVHLEHVEYWSYMRKRWELEEGKNYKNLITNRYFFNEGSDSSTARNGLVRLWYMAHYSYDKEAEDKFWLTNFFFNDNDLQELVIERSFTRNEKFAFNLIKAIKEFSEEKYYPTRLQKRGLFSELNKIGGVKILDMLDYNDIKKIIWNYFE